MLSTSALNYSSYRFFLLSLIMLGLLNACSDPATTGSSSQQIENPSASAEPATGRWYSEEQEDLGATVFAANCASCHGDKAQGLYPQWRERLDDGSLPPPPLNGSAHAWHHPQSVLLQVINGGGLPFGGNMPAFASVLMEHEKLAAIAYFQGFWSEEIYDQWRQMGGTN